MRLDGPQCRSGSNGEQCLAPVGKGAPIPWSSIPYAVAKMQVAMTHKRTGRRGWGQPRSVGHVNRILSCALVDIHRRSPSVMPCLIKNVPGCTGCLQVALTDSLTGTDASMSPDKMSMGA
jgi:hypothetical protein